MICLFGISIIICSWNRAETLRSTLISLSLQIEPGNLDVEVIVVDNNSTDSTKLVVEEYMKSWHFGTLRYLFEPRQGKQFALNSGINASRYEILAFSDDDIIFSENWTCEIARVFSDNTIDLVGGKTLISWSSAGAPIWYHPNMAAVLGGVNLGDERLSPISGNYAPAGANMIVRKTLFQRIGHFSEAHFRHMDYEFGVRSKNSKATIAYEPTLLVYAPVDNACLTKRYFRRWAFKAGIAQDQEEQRGDRNLILGVPRWTYRQFSDDLIFMLFRSYFNKPSENFSRELRMWRSMGKIFSSWHQILRPMQHTAWIEKYSQKKKNIF
jgi:glycosyltransferase involved in cell wall biosynthesis